MTSNNLQEQLRFFISHGDNILKQYLTFKRQGKDATSAIARETLSETASVIATSIFELPFGGKYVKKGVKGFLDIKQRQQLEAMEQTYETEYLSWLGSIRGWLQNVSIDKPNLKQPGNSQLFLFKLARSQQYTKLDTRIRKALALLNELSGLQLIQNDQIPVAPITYKPAQVIASSRSTEAHNTLEYLERELRTLIHTRLELVSPRWWTQFIPEDVRLNAEKRKSKNEKPWPWHTQTDLHLIHYVDFADYVKIITRGDNWDKVFKNIFGDKEIISVKLRELEPIRNSIGHSREITDMQIDKLKLYSHEIVKAIGDSK